MSSKNSLGSDWTQPEIDLVVSDYFDMRAKFLRGEPFIKARHYKAVMEATGRSKGAVESKCMNISATLERLGLPWLAGYAPLRNFQKALLQSVEQFVAKEWNEEIIGSPAVYSTIAMRPLVMEPAPVLTGPVISTNPDLERLAKKFDPAARDDRNRKLGLAGEKRAYESERLRLTAEGRHDLAKKVLWVSQERGDGAGYDILSFDDAGRERFLEVKTTIGDRFTPFYLSRNEKEYSEAAGEQFRIYRIFDWAINPRAFLIEPPLGSALILEPIAYRASFGGGG